MIPDKEMKKKYKPIFSKNPDKYYSTEVLKEEGFKRFKCENCNKYFWSLKKKNVCGEPNCSGEMLGFIGKKRSSDSYVQIWKKFSTMFKKLGYTPIKRYPVVSRWNPTMEYTNASIAAFQPYVISGEVEPPANPLVIPQVCLRFGDTDNVGITMSHLNGFVMIGQHMFVEPKDWDKNKVMKDMLKWTFEGMSLDKKDVTFHEDAWAGGGNLGPCMEMFVSGVEVWNQVYMMYEQTSKGVRELDIKVLDMGMGLERNVWFLSGKETIYDATFPETLEKVKDKIKFKVDKKLLKTYAPYAAMLNSDEVDDIDKVWKQVAKKTKIKDVKEKIMPLAALYSVVEHSRALMFAINDGALPSNVGGGYNLRMLVRRALGFIDEYSWDLDLGEICAWHAKELKEIFPELLKNLDMVQDILKVEKSKYDNSREKAKGVVEKLKGVDVSEKKLLKLYDSQGITPEMLGIKVDNFYMKVAELHDKNVDGVTEVTEKAGFLGTDDTEALYFDDYLNLEFDAKVVNVKNKFVLLDKTAFYPTSGGQVHDIGTLNGVKVLDVFKEASYIVHIMDKPLKKGLKVKGEIEKSRRVQLAQHHTATHIINAAARKVLGKHVNQAGAFKDVDKARLDITHYDSVNDLELSKIEDEANKIVKKKKKVKSYFLPRGEAEKKFGMAIYQGGAVPGKKLRIIEIVGEDVQACGGTHVKNTSEVGKIKILKSTKVQDGVVRLVFVAGEKALESEKAECNVVCALATELGCSEEQVPARCSELFTLWKKVVKKKKDLPKKLVSKEKYKGDVLLEACKMLKTQPEHVLKTVKRFKKDLNI
jgi:alanyl-tRNA synthetase